MCISSGKINSTLFLIRNHQVYFYLVFKAVAWKLSEEPAQFCTNCFFFCFFLFHSHFHNIKSFLCQTCGICGFYFIYFFFLSLLTLLILPTHQTARRHGLIKKVNRHSSIDPKQKKKKGQLRQYEWILEWK